MSIDLSEVDWHLDRVIQIWKAMAELPPERSPFTGEVSKALVLATIAHLEAKKLKLVAIAMVEDEEDFIDLEDDDYEDDGSPLSSPKKSRLKEGLQNFSTPENRGGGPENESL